MRAIAAITLVLVAGSVQGKPAVSFPTPDGGTIHGDVYGTGDRGVVLAHGGKFTRDGWAKQAQALAEAGFRALAIDYRGEGESRGGPKTRASDDGLRFDVLGAVRYLKTTGAKTVSIVGASMGADAAAEASIESDPGEIDRIVFLAGGGYAPSEMIKGRKLFILARDDANAEGPRLLRIQKAYDVARQPKELVILDGSAHAQFLFDTDQGDRLMKEILRFLSQP